MLKVQNLHINYGNIEAIKDISFDVKQGSIVALLGSNGAGKSTILKAISGLLQPIKGDISYDGRSLLRKRASDIVKDGIVHSIEGRGIFPDFTVEENLMVGAYTRKHHEIVGEMEKVFNYFPRLRERRKQKGQTLSGGEAQMLAIARSLMARPKMLLLDEPSLGIAPILVTEVFQMIKKIKEGGTTILLVEQNANIALSIADYGYVLENGRIALQGKASELRENQDVRKFYLGG